MSKLRIQAKRAAKEVREAVADVEKQFEDCSRSVDSIAELRSLQLHQVHQRVRQSLFTRLKRAQMEVSKLDSGH